MPMEADPERPVIEKRKTVEGDAPLLCALVVGDDGSGTCFKDSQACEQFAAADHGATRYSSCTPQNAGACFNANVVLTEARIAICAPTISDCEKRLAFAKTNPDYEVMAKQCGIYRNRTTTP